MLTATKKQFKKNQNEKLRQFPIREIDREREERKGDKYLWVRQLKCLQFMYLQFHYFARLFTKTLTSRAVRCTLSVVRRRRIMRHNYGCFSLGQRKGEEGELCLARKDMNTWARGRQLSCSSSSLRLELSAVSAPCGNSPSALPDTLNCTSSLCCCEHTQHLHLSDADRGGAEALQIIFMSSAFNGRQWTQVDNR